MSKGANAVVDDVVRAYKLHRLMRGDEDALQPTLTEAEALDLLRFMGKVGKFKDGATPEQVFEQYRKHKKLESHDGK